MKTRRSRPRRGLLRQIFIALAWLPAGRRLVGSASSLDRPVGGISNPQPPHPRKRRNLMLLRPRNTQNIFHRNLPHQQRVRNQRPMTPPRHNLRAHDRRRLSSSQPLQTRQPCQKLLRLHVIRKSTKASIVPTEIRRVSLRMPQSAEFLQMRISNPSRPQTPRQCFPIELRIVPRTRNAARIHHAPHSMRPQNLNKFRKRPRGMSNRKNSGLHFFPPHVHLTPRVEAQSKLVQVVLVCCPGNMFT